MTSSTQTIEQLRDAVHKKEEELTAQLDRVYDMVDQKKPAEFVQIEYKRAVERITEKYALLVEILELRADGLDADERTKQEEAIRDQYKEDVVTLAVAIDQVLEQTTQ